MVVCTIDCRTHQISRTRIYTNILFVDVLLMNGLCHNTAIRSQHKASHLGIDGNISHSRRDKHFVKRFVDTLTDHTDVIGLLIRCIRNSYTAGKIDKTDVTAGLLLQLHHEFKQLLCQLRIIFIGYCIAGQKGMDTEILCPLALKDLIGINQLILGHTILGISGVVHDSVAEFEHTSRIIAAADGLRNVSDGLLQEINMGKIIQIDNSAKLICVCKFLRRRIVGRKHNVLAIKPTGLGKHQLCIR